MSIVDGDAIQLAIYFDFVLAFGCAKEALLRSRLNGCGDRHPPSSSVSVTSVQVANDRFVIRGTNLKAVKSAKTGPRYE